MKTVKSMIADILRREGGFTADPDDPGHQLRVSRGHKWDSHCTNHGITQYTLSSYWKRQATKHEVRMLTSAEAAEIYKHEYFYKPGFNNLPATLQSALFDMGVNHGPRNAVRMLQTLCNKIERELKVDGRLGFKTNSTVQKHMTNMGGWFNNALVEERIAFYERIIARKPSQAKYRNGWMRRANEFIVEDAGEIVVKKKLTTLADAVARIFPQFTLGGLLNVELS